MSAIKDLYDIIKEFKDLVKQYQNAEMSEKLVSVQSCYFDVREELLNLQDENRRLKEEIKRLQDVSQLEKDLVLEERGYLIRKSEKDAGKNIHYCAACWQNHKKLMPIVRTIGSAEQCCNCQMLIR